MVIVVIYNVQQSSEPPSRTDKFQIISKPIQLDDINKDFKVMVGKTFFLQKLPLFIAFPHFLF